MPGTDRSRRRSDGGLVQQVELNELRPEPLRSKAGDRGVMLAMGPGFCSEFLLLQW